MSKQNDPYLIENSSVLKNKAGITSQKELESYEYDIVSLRIAELQKKGLVVTKVHNILDIHEYLFSPLFDWAGKFRTITMYKSEPILDGYSVDYTPSGYIEKELDDLEDKFRQINWSNLNREDTIKQVSSIIQ